MITLPNNVEIHFATGAKALSGTIDASALVTGVVGWDTRAVTFTSAAHGVLATSDLLISGLNNAEYKTNQIRNVLAVATNTMTVTLGRSESFVAATPAGTETWGVGFSSTFPYYFLGFKLHLNAADAAGETLSLVVDADKGAAWDTKIYSKVMTDVTDIINFPQIKIPIAANDQLKFAWTNTGGKTWGVEIHVQRRV